MNITTTTEIKTPRPALDHAKIDNAISMSRLTKTWRHPWDTRPCFLPALPHISTNAGNNAINHTGPFDWYDPITGVFGGGAIALVAHIQKIPPEEAARRLAMFLWYSATIWMRGARQSGWRLAVAAKR